MIQINLLPGVKRKRAGGAKAQVAAKFKELAARVKDPLLLIAGLVWIGTIAFLALSWVGTRRKLAEVEPRLEQAREENRRFQNLLTQKRKAELIRDSLLAQIGVIRTVDGNRYVWPHVLDEVTKALPAYTWLTSVNVLVTPTQVDSADSLTARPMQFEIAGRTVDIQAYTKFLRQLEASPWIRDVTGVSVKTEVVDERAVTAFTIRAAFARADSAYIRTVPLSQSVR